MGVAVLGAARGPRAFGGVGTNSYIWEAWEGMPAWNQCYSQEFPFDIATCAWKSI